jgi:hypothetical protein
MIKENQLLRDGKIDQTGLEQLFHSMMLLGPAFEIYVVDLKGDILAFSALEGKVKRRNIDVAPVTEFLRGQVSLPLLGDDPCHLSRKKIFSAAKITHNDARQGYLYVIIGSELQDQVFANQLDNRIINQSIAIFIGVVISTILASIIITISNKGGVKVRRS